MTKEEEKRKDLLNNIIVIELRMFQQVKTSEPSLCQNGWRPLEQCEE